VESAVAVAEEDVDACIANSDYVEFAVAVEVLLISGTAAGWGVGGESCRRRGGLD